MKKSEYINTNIDKKRRLWSIVGSLLGAIFFPLLSIMDYFGNPENYEIFMSYRICGSFLLIICCLLFIKLKITRLYQFSIITFAIIISATVIELMILNSGGHKSTYYVGMIILITCVFVLIPLNLFYSIFGVSLVYSIYLVPILLFDEITDTRTFFIANSFMFTFSVIALVWRYFSFESLKNELGLQYELNEKNQKLETYSNQLEYLVDERTKELKESESKLKKSESMLRSLFEYATDGIMILDRDGKILDINQKACEIYGFDRNELVSKNIQFLTVDKSMSKERIDRILNGESLLFETQHIRKNDKKVSLEITANAIEVEGKVLIQAFVRNITDKKRLQEQLLQSQKMESIGSLAGGIAHNFNNLLTAILGNAELLEEYNYPDDKPKKRIKNIENSAKKAGALVSKLLSFARQDSFEITPLNLNDMINEVLLFEGVLGKKIQIQTNLNKVIPTVEGDHNQLEQVIMNLIVNARDAMPDGGLITITTSVVEVEKDHIDIPTYINPGHYVLLTVSDTGCGIRENIINRVFEPFFTTKERGKGTGLGLTTVYGIIKDHKGHITVQSEVDKETTFYVYLPVSAKPVPKIIEPEHVDLYGHENILVVDDEEDVLDYIKDSLETHGYQAIVTNNPLEAIDLFKELVDEVDLVITDIIMPQMEGKDLIRHLRSFNPDIKIIAISGYSDEPIRKENMLIDAFIKKPFEGSHLLTTVRHVLDGKTPADYQDTIRMAT